MNKKKVYTLNYWLKNSDGNVIDTSEGGEPMVFIEDGKNVIAGIIKAVENRNEGDKLEIVIPPELAYGSHDPELVSQVPVNLFDGVENIEKGMKFQTNTGGAAKIIKVLEVGKDMVTVDANHPLAGLALNFDIEIVEVRDASEAEISSGHVHRG